jgi:hypothetical protein
MTVRPDKLEELVYSLSEDQKRLLREGLAEGENLDPSKLAETFSSFENQEEFRKLAADAPDAGTGDAGAPDGGTPPTTLPDGGTPPSHPPPPEPPLTRW